MSEHALYTKLAKYYDFIYREYLEATVPRLVDAIEKVLENTLREK